MHLTPNHMLNLKIATLFGGPCKMSPQRQFPTNVLLSIGQPETSTHTLLG